MLGRLASAAWRRKDFLSHVASATIGSALISIAERWW